MGNDVIDDRLRASRPPSANVEAEAFDRELLARVRAQPVAPRRRRPRAYAIPAAAAATLLTTAAVMLGAGRVTSAVRRTPSRSRRRCAGWTRPRARSCMSAASRRPASGRRPASSGSRPTTRSPNGS